jgi:hypothetical protein
MMGNTSLSTPDLVRRARDDLRTVELARLQVTIGDCSIDVHHLLETMLVGAEYSSGGRYSASAIINAHKLSEPGKQLKKLAHDWLHFFLLPCASAPCFLPLEYCAHSLSR